MPIDWAVADEWGRMSAKRSLSTIDALLAATAKVNGMSGEKLGAEMAGWAGKRGGWQLD